MPVQMLPRGMVLKAFSLSVGATYNEVLEGHLLGSTTADLTAFLKGF